jgi:hypothetical protein
MNCIYGPIMRCARPIFNSTVGLLQPKSMTFGLVYRYCLVGNAILFPLASASGWSPKAGIMLEKFSLTRSERSANIA